ncbi:MAG TPA: DUF6250 domain-containing protein [Lacunisphaera sp.]
MLFLGSLSLLLAVLPVAAGAPVARDDFSADQGRWVVEQMPGGKVTVGGGALTIEDAAGCTVWWREKLTAPVVISYEATVIEAGGPHDRVSDLNCFWMASDPRQPDLFAPGHGRTGKFENYDALQTYYVGQGGNTNTTTRFRRYAGGGLKPLLPGHDRQEPAVLLKGNQPYRITLMALADGTVRYYRDDVLIFDYKDPAPLTAGWFGFRTVHSHLRIRDFKVTRP